MVDHSLTHPHRCGWVFCFPRRRQFLAWLWLTLLLVPSALAQDSQQFEIRDVRFVGNTAFSEEELGDIIITRPRPGIISRFFYSVFGEKFGTATQVFDADVLRLDVEKVRMFYHDNGYFDATVKDSLAVDTSSSSVDIFIVLTEGKPSFIDSIEYHGLETIPPDVRQKLLAEPVLQKGMRFEKQKVSDEVDRMIRLFENEGYPTAQFDRERSVVSRYLSTNNIHLVVAFTVGRRFTFGPVSVVVDPQREDITEDIVLKQLDFQEGDMYSREKRAMSERNLNRLGLFEATQIDAVPTAGAETTGVVPVVVTVRPRDKHELNPEISVSDENYAFNLSFGIGYTNRNFFGDARSFNTRLRLRTQSIQEWNFSELTGGRGFRDTSILGAVELQFHLAQPYLFTRTLSGTWTFSLSAEKQKLYILPIIRNKIGLSNRFGEFTYGFLDWTLERVSVEFQDTARVLVDLSRRLEEERPQFNSILSATLQRDRTNDIFSPSSGSFQSITLEESGILPRLLQKLQPDLPFTQFYKVTALGKYYSDVSDSRFTIFAFKIRAGYQDKYGASKRDSTIRIPLNRRFFAGGSGSVRGWKSRDLGTMPDNELQFGGNFTLEGSYEMRVNHFQGFGKLWFIDLDNFWAVYFLDAGNVWTDLASFHPKDIAIAAGVGIRYETLFGPFRVDFGFRIYDPKEIPSKQWVFDKRFFGEVLKNGVLHFGLGHAF